MTINMVRFTVFKQHRIHYLLYESCNKNYTALDYLGLTFHPRMDISITTPMNWVNRIMGVRNDHTGQSAMLKLNDAAIKVAVVVGAMAGYTWS